MRRAFDDKVLIFWFPVLDSVSVIGMLVFYILTRIASNGEFRIMSEQQSRWFIELR